MTTPVQSAPALRSTPHSKGIRGLLETVVERRVHVWLAGILVLIVALQQNFSDIPKTRFHPDESRWINRAVYVRDAMHPLSDAWEERYLTRGQPPGGSYVTGLGLLVQGKDLDANGPWHFNFGGESNIWWNVARGNMPSWEYLEAARRTSAVIGAVTALLLFLIVTRITNAAGGLVAGVFFAVHPLSVYLSTLAVSDAAFTCMIALSTLVGMMLAAKPTWPRAILLGVILGLGASTKLSPILLAVALAGVGVAFAASPWLNRVPPFRWLYTRVPGASTERARRLGWMLIAQPVVAFLFFFVTYPYLWPSPIDRTRSLFAFRTAELANQQRIWPKASIDSRLEAFGRTWTMLEDRFSASGKVIGQIASALGRDFSERGIDLPIAISGGVVLLALAVRRGVTSPSYMAMLIAGGQAALIIGGLRIDFDRYYLPLVFVSGIGIGVVSGALWTGMARLARRSSSRATPRAAVLGFGGSTTQSAD